MQCPFCQNIDSRVLESSSMCGGFAVRRRRECLNCLKRFTTVEIIQSDLINPFEMNKFYKYLGNTNQSQNESDKLERKEFKKLTKSKSEYYWNSINLDKLYEHLNKQETIIIRMRFIEEATTEAVADFVGISEKEVRSAELKALKFLRAL